MLCLRPTLRVLRPALFCALVASCAGGNGSLVREAGPASDAVADALAAETASPVCAPLAPPTEACPCEPGALRCSDDRRSVLRCESNGRSLTAASSCPAAQRCDEGRCVDPCADAAARNDSQGCAFTAVQTPNSGLGRMADGASRDQFPFAIALASRWAEPVSVRVEGGPLPAPVERTIAPRDALVLELPWLAATVDSGPRGAQRSAVTRGGALRVTASMPVAAYQFSPLAHALAEDCNQPRCYSFTNDASLLLPTHALRTRYVAAARETVRLRARGDTRWQAAPGFVSIAAPARADGRRATITVRSRARTEPGDGVTALAPGGVLTVGLDPGDVLQLISPVSAVCTVPEPDRQRGDTFCRPERDEDLTGTEVESDLPVAVFSGHDCALVPYDRLACDHLEEQLTPTESLGRAYTLARTPPSADEPALVRVVAAHANTRVTFEPAALAPPVTLASAGDFTEIVLAGVGRVAADQPVLVAQFLVGGAFEPDAPALNGDPAMALATPEEQFRGGYLIYAPERYEHLFVTALAPRGEALFVDGVPARAARVGSVGDLDALHFAVSGGPHTLSGRTAAIRFSATVTGLANYTAFAFPGGFTLAPIAPR